MPRFSLIGHGAIGRALTGAWKQGALPGWELAAVLVRSAAAQAPWLTADTEPFFAAPTDLIIEVAGPQALAQHAARALRHAPLWTVSAAALADEALRHALETAARASGHRLRLLAGAITGLDGLAALAAQGTATLQLDIDLPPSDAAPGLVFQGTARDAALRFPGQLNVAAASALAGPGLEATWVRVHQPGPVESHRLALQAQGPAGQLRIEVRPRLSPSIHPVANAIVAALRRELAPLQIG